MHLLTGTEDKPYKRPHAMNRKKINMTLQEKYVTDRLLIRKPIQNDIQEVFEKLANCADSTKYLSWTRHSHIDETDKFIKGFITKWDNAESFAFTICLKDTEEIIGMLEASISGCKALFGYALAKAYWKKGYMCEALEPIKEALFRNDDIYRIWAVCDLENYGSKRVMEKIGMNSEGILRKWLVHPNVSQEPRDCFVYAIVKEK